MSLKPLPLILSAIAALCFIAAFMRPLVCSDFSLEKVPYLDQADDLIDAPCEQIVQGIREAELGSGTTEKDQGLLERARDQAIDAAIETIPDAWWDRLWETGVAGCDVFMEAWIQDKVYEVLDTRIGTVRDPRNGDDLDWKSCRAEVEQGADTRDLGSCCGNEKGPLQTCMKWWMVDKGGVPFGDQYLVEIISRLFDSDDVPLGLMLVLFSICFPLLKVGMCLYLSIRDVTPRSMRFLSITAKWSMTDVFIVALLITFFKADSFNFRFEAGTGLYLFAAGAILSSVAVALLERSCRSTDALDISADQEQPGVG